VFNYNAIKKNGVKTAQLHPALNTILEEHKWSACCSGNFWIVSMHTWDQESNRIQWRTGKSLFLERPKFRSLPLTSYFTFRINAGHYLQS